MGDCGEGTPEIEACIGCCKKGDAASSPMVGRRGHLQMPMAVGLFVLQSLMNDTIISVNQPLLLAPLTSLTPQSQSSLTSSFLHIHIVIGNCGQRRTAHV